MVKRTKRKVALSTQMARVRIRTLPAKQKRTKRVGAPVAIDPFIHCVLGPVAQTGDGQGAPDGSIDSSVVVEHRQTVVIFPSAANSDICFALVSSPYGAVGLGSGTTNTTVNKVDAVVNPATYTGPFTGTFAGDFGFGQGDDNYSVIPFAESLRPDGAIGDWPNAGFVATHYRVLTTQARVSYTGSTFQDNGTAATCRVSYGIDEDVVNPMSAGGFTASNWLLRGNRLPNVPPTGFTSVASMAGSRVFPARESCNLINVPTDLNYQEIRSSWGPFTQEGESLSLPGIMVNWFTGIGYDGTNYLPIPTPGLGYAPISFYAASGMAVASSVTVEVRTCVEYRLQFNSPAARFAHMPPIARPLAIQAVKNIARTIPSSIPSTPETEKNGWLGNALSWYGNTMKNVIGGSWNFAGNLLQAAGKSGLPLGQQLGGIISAGGQTITGRNRGLALL